MGQIEKATGGKALKVWIYTQETEQLHHKDKMEIGIAVFEIVEQRERPVKERKKRIITAILAQGISEQLGKIESDG